MNPAHMLVWLRRRQLAAASWFFVAWVTMGMPPVALADPAGSSVETTKYVENAETAKNVENLTVFGGPRLEPIASGTPAGAGQDRILRRGGTSKAGRARALQSGQDRDGRPRSGTLVRRVPWYRSAVASLVIVLLLLGVVYWAVRRWVPVARAPDNRVIQVVARTAISPKQGLALVRLGRRFVLVGTSAERMDMLADISEPAEVADLLMELGGGVRQSKGQFDKLLNRSSRGLGIGDTAGAGVAAPSPLRTVPDGLTEDTDDERVSGAMAALRDRLRTFGTRV